MHKSRHANRPSFRVERRCGACVDADCGGDFKLANIMEVPGSPGDLRVTDLGPKPWREWWANAVVPEARMNGIEPEKYLDFDWRLETMDV